MMLGFQASKGFSRSRTNSFRPKPSPLFLGPQNKAQIPPTFVPKFNGAQKNKPSSLFVGPSLVSRSFTTLNEMEHISELILAASSNNLVEVKRLVEKEKVDPNGCNYDRRTALHLAATEGYLDVCKYLVSKGARVNSVDRMGGTPLMDSIRYKHEAVSQYLKQQGGKVYNNKDDVAGMLCQAANLGQLTEVKQLVEGGADINYGDYDSRTALHLAVAEGQLEVVEFLLKNGAQVNLTDRFGRTPLNEALVATKNGDAIIKLLKQFGAVTRDDILELIHTTEFFSAARRSLPILCEAGRWSYGETWVPAKNGATLECTDTWYADAKTIRQLVPVRRASEKISYNANEGVLGKVWSTKSPSWIRGAYDFMDIKVPLEVLKKSGIKSGLAVPVLYNETVLAVLLFFGTLERPEDIVLTQHLFQLSNHLVPVGILPNSKGSGKPPALLDVFEEQRNLVKDLIVEEGVFTSDLITDEVDWFYNKMGFPSVYFEHFAPPQIAQHLHSLIAAKKVAQISGDKENIAIGLEHENNSFFICPAKKDQLLGVENKLEEKMKEVSIYNAANPQDPKIYSLAILKSKNPILPTGNTNLFLNIFTLSKVGEPLPEESESDLWRISSGEFMRDKPQLVKERYKSIIDRAISTVAPVMEIFPPYKDGTIPIMVGFRPSRTKGYLTTITELIHHYNLNCERKFVQSFSNGVIVMSFYVQPASNSVLREFLDQLGLLLILPQTPLSPLYLDQVFTAQQLMYATAGLHFCYYFLNQPYAEEIHSLQNALKNDPLNKGRLSTLQQRLQRDSVTESRISECFALYPQIVQEIFADFETVFSPSLNADKKKKPQFNQNLANKIKKIVQNDLDGQILNTLLAFNSCIVKTNFFKKTKSAVSFRLIPSFLKDTPFPEVPFGLFLVIGSEFRGFHVRFKDIARGGIRIIRSSNPQIFNKNLESQFIENYNLAYTQQKKNKDIPEFGSKGTILLNPSHQHSSVGAFRKYVDGLLDLLLVNEEIVDHYESTELLFLGPDEGTADFMDWAALYARSRGYRFWKSFTTGKSVHIGGIPHDRYGMTTRSIHCYVLGSLKKHGLDEARVTKLQTGGPDGDLGSNEILISKDKTIGVVDGSGVLFDPLGLNREELARLAHERKMVNHFDRKFLSKDGFLVLIGDRDVKLPSGEIVESGLTFRNEFHLHPLSAADMFVPCGGRPESINVKNVNRLFKPDGSPKFKFIIEGANLFLTQDARLVLENAGVVVFKDASANKGGVTSSSLEVLAALAFDDAEFEVHMQIKGEVVPEFYQTYVKEVQKTIEMNANMEFECLWQEKQRTGTPMCILTDLVSDKINDLNVQIINSPLWDDIELRKAILNQAIPKPLLDLLGLETILKRVPANYIKAIFGAFLASHYIYRFGLSVSEFKFFEFMNKISGNGGLQYLGPQ